jgi:hypothetical protein
MKSQVAVFWVVTPCSVVVVVVVVVVGYQHFGTFITLKM